MLEPPSVEIAMAKDKLVELNFSCALGSQSGVQIGSAPSIGNRAQGNQS